MAMNAIRKKGIDISAFQGKPDFAKIKAAGYEFVIIRAGWGTGKIDPQFERNYTEAIKAGLKFGVYWFMYCVNNEQAQKNAMACLNAIKGKKIEYGVWCDCEYDSASYYYKVKEVPMTKTVASGFVVVFLETAKAAGYEVGNYTNLDYYRNMFTKEVNEKYPVWFAWWSKESTLSNASELWQYSSKGQVPGIIGHVDMDEAHREYPSPNPKPVPDVPVTPGSDTYPIPEVYRLVFDPDWYWSRYADLQQVWAQMVASGAVKNEKATRDWWLFQHFYKNGMEEIFPENLNASRYGCPSFSVWKYKNAHEDIQKGLGKDAPWHAYYDHYMQFGAQEIAEGKRGWVDLSV